MTTKEQERKALEKIRKIVEELGPDSYIGMAFEGCFEIAEENISNDFGCSMKQRAVSAEAEAESLREKVDKLTEERNAQEEAIGRLEEERDEQRKHIPPAWLREEALAMAKEGAKNARAWMENAAETMANLAETPHDIAFVHAVESYRKAKDQRFTCEKIAKGIEDIGYQPRGERR